MFGFIRGVERNTLSGYGTVKGKKGMGKEQPAYNLFISVFSAGICWIDRKLGVLVDCRIVKWSFCMMSYLVETVLIAVPTSALHSF